MNFKIDLGKKFGCIALVNAWKDSSLVDPVDLGGGLWAVFQPPLQFADHWKTWIGSISARQLAQANMFIFAEKSSSNLGVLDQENQTLQKKVSYLFYGLLLSGVPQYDKGFLFTGANESGEPEVRQFGELDDYVQTSGNERLSKIDLVKLKGATVSMGMIQKLSDRELSERLTRGFSSLLRAVKEREGPERLHLYVRALEAVVHPEIGRSARQFVHRCLTFVRVDGHRMDKAREVLDDAYEIRSQVEHQNGWEEALDAHPASAREEIAKNRLRQVERLTLSVYWKITTISGLLPHFQNDMSLDGFWQLGDDDRRRQWPEPIDIVPIA
jgi:hypothetical protein